MDGGRRIVIVIAGVAAIAAIVWVSAGVVRRAFFAPADIGAAPGVDSASLGGRGANADGSSEVPSAPWPIETVASGLEVPWEIAFLPGGDMLVTERPGRLTRIGARRVSYDIPGVARVGEGGLLGMALHPDFERNSWLYLYMTTDEDGIGNRIVRYRFTDEGPVEPTVIFDDIPGAQYHDGGRIAFGPDGMLYATTGDASVSSRAQDRASVAGKVLRVRDDGSVPEGNPFGTAVWSYGHRNAQGLAWDAMGRLWATEHGRSGAASGFDELNRIEPGVNYGWPTIQGDETRAGMRAPAAHSGADATWAPAGVAIIGQSIFFAGLRGNSLYEARIADNGSIADMRAHFTREYGRLRAVVAGPDGMLYVGTSNRDGRGSPTDDDDRILRIDPAVFR